MSDLLFLVLVVAFFAAAAGLVAVCERIIGPDEPTPAADSAGEA